MTTTLHALSLPELSGLGRPRWRHQAPLLWRDQRCIQVGDVIVDGVEPADVTWLATLDGTRTSDDVSADARGGPPARRRLVAALAAAGGLDDGGRTPTALRWAEPASRNSLARAYDAAVDAYRDAPAAIEAMGRREAARVAVVGTGPLAGFVRRSTADGGLVIVDDPAGADLTVLADSSHPDVPAAFDSDVHAHPHLHVGAFGARAVVGPLVVPGSTSCLRCHHLHLRDADAAWPVLAVQWSHAVAAMSEPPLDSLLVSAAAAHALLLVRAWVDAPERPERWADLAVELRLPDAAARSMHRPAHPLCGCRWSDEP